MPFKTAFKTLGGVPSFDARLSDTHHSMVIANYGASQVGVGVVAIGGFVCS